MTSMRLQRTAKTSSWRTARACRGAALPLALLLFLVCSLLASVVVAAGSAAGGRQAQQADMDQRYYSVVSAAKLVQDQFQGKQVDIVCKQVKDVSTTVTYGTNGTVKRATPVETVKSVSVSIDGKQIAQGSDSVDIDKSALTLPELSALYVLTGSNSTQIDPLGIWDRAALDTALGTEEFQVGAYMLSALVSSAPTDVDASVLENVLSVAVNQWVLDGGDLRFQLDSAPTTGDPEGSDIYSITLNCTADIDAVESSQETQRNTGSAGGAASYTRIEQSTVTTTREATISWSAAELFKTGADEEVGA